jgi:hypothetical protein
LILVTLAIKSKLFWSILLSLLWKMKNSIDTVQENCFNTSITNWKTLKVSAIKA